MKITAVVALALLLAGASPASQGGTAERPAHTLTDAAAFDTRLLAALDTGDVAAARALMLADKGGASQRVIATIADPNGKAARTAYDARRQVLDHVIDETVRRVQQDPKMRGRVVLVEVGGTAGLEGPGFSPKKSDLDYVGDANEFVRRDYYERGAAREVRPDGTLGPPITVEQLYEQRGWPPPEITEGNAFGTDFVFAVAYVYLKLHRPDDALKRHGADRLRDHGQTRRVAGRSARAPVCRRHPRADHQRQLPRAARGSVLGTRWQAPTRLRGVHSSARP